MFVPWLDLPNEVWELILGYLNVRSLLRASETCSKFNDVMGQSKKLMKMIRLYIKIPGHIFLTGFHGQQEKLKGHRQIKALQENLLMSGRNYQNLGLSKFGCSSNCNYPKIANMTNILMDICEILQLFSENIIDFEISISNIEIKMFIKIISKFRNLQKFVIKESTHIFGDACGLSLNLPKLQHISLQNVEKLMIQNSFSFEHLKSLEIFERNDNLDEKRLRKLLLRQNHLKVLHVKSNKIFGQNILPNAEFSLESLSLKCNKWKNMDYAESFFKKQKHLKNISLKLNNIDEGLQFRYIDILKYIFNLNQNLTEISLEISFAIEDITFLDGISRPKVKSLSFESHQVNSKLFAALVKMCSKVKELTIESNLEEIDRAAISTLLELETLKISRRRHALKDLLICSERFLNLSILDYGHNDDVVLFLSNHQSIEHLIIQKDYVSYGLCEHIVSYLPNLHSFKFDRLETPTETLQLLITLKYLRCLKITSYEWMDQHESEFIEICNSAGIKWE